MMHSMQDAQKEKNVEEKVTKKKSMSKKLSTVKIMEKRKKSSYARSYAHYPHKKSKKIRFT